MCTRTCTTVFSERCLIARICGNLVGVGDTGGAQYGGSVKEDLAVSLHSVKLLHSLVRAETDLSILQGWEYMYNVRLY